MWMNKWANEWINEWGIAVKGFLTYLSGENCILIDPPKQNDVPVSGWALNQHAALEKGDGLNQAQYQGLYFT